MRKRVLVVDDDALFLRALEEALAEEFDVAAECSPRRALVRVAEGGVDVVLADIAMPEMAGWEFQAELALLAPSLASRTVFMTGRRAEDAALFVSRLPRHRLLLKPFALEAAVAALRRATAA